MAERPAHELRRLLSQPGIIKSMGAHDVLSAMLMEQAGFPMLFLGGFNTSATQLGLPDLNFLGLAEMVDAVARTARRVTTPIVADADTGHGGVHNVHRCVRELESAGAAGIILEDQLFPKRCGHFDKKSVVPAEEMIQKFRAASDAREDEDFVVFARTDSRATHGIDEAIDRVNRYIDAGADVAFVEAPESIEEIEAIAECVAAPKMINMLAFGKTPILDAARVEEMGYKIIVAPIASLLASVKTMKELFASVFRDGHAQSFEDRMVSFADIKQLLGVDEFLSLEQKLRKPGE